MPVFLRERGRPSSSPCPEGQKLEQALMVLENLLFNDFPELVGKFCHVARSAAFGCPWHRSPRGPGVG